MTRGSQHRRAHGSLAVRLLAVVLVPLLAVQFLVWRRTTSQQEVARAARQFAAPLALLHAAGDLFGPAALEESASVGLATADVFLGDRANARALTGIDLEAAVGEAREAVDRGFERLASIAGDATLESGRPLAYVLVELRQELDLVRLDVDAAGGEPRAIRSTFESIQSVVTEVANTQLVQLQSINDVDFVHHELVDRIDGLVAVEVASFSESRAVSLAISPFAAGTEPIQAIAAGGFTDASEQKYTDMLEGEQLAAWMALKGSPEAAQFAQLRERLWNVLASRGPDSSITPLAEPEVIPLLGEYYGASIERLLALSEYGSAELDRIGVEIAAHGATTERDLQRWYVALALVTLGSLMLLFLAVRSIALPLRRLTIRAGQLGSGHFTGDPLPVSGPTDIRTVTTSFNELTATLTAYEQQLNTLADGPLTGRTPAVELPGALGRSMRETLQLTQRDLLTGLPNRFAAIERVDSLLASHHRVGVVLIDIDSFKRLNEGRGFGTGDLILAEVSRRLQRAVRDGEFVARLGSDEFLIVAQSVADTAMALRISDRLLSEVAQPYEFEGSLIGLSATAGVALGREGGDARELVREAEVALHRAKSQGRGRVEVFSVQLQEQVEELSTIEGALNGAVERNEFEMYLQPVVELETGRLWGGEALVRWNRPGHGIVSPAGFLSIAEGCGVTVELERWVIGEAARILATWQGHPSTKHLKLAVNVSGRHLLEGDLIIALDQAAASFDLDLKSLEIELTETALLADFDRASEILGSIRERGVNVAIDDFGTGYSSMNYLGVLPVDTIKIDRLFVARAGTSGYDRSILEIIVQLGQLLGLSVVAEGVEHADQLSFLEARGCDRAQGYLISHPLPEPEFARWVESGAWRLAEARV